MVRVLFVCLGNICRSPTAEGVFRRVVEDAGLSHVVECDSAGTHAYHSGEGADARSARAAKRRGYDLATHRARQVRDADFADFDYILAMDRDNLAHLQNLGQVRISGGPRGKARPTGAVREIGPEPDFAKVQLFLDYASAAAVREVPDPYARGEEGFEQVLDLVESACEGLLEHIRTQDLAAGRSR